MDGLERRGAKWGEGDEMGCVKRETHCKLFFAAKVTRCRVEVGCHDL